MTCFDELFGKLVKPVEIIRGEVEVGFVLELPAKAQPLNGFNNGIDVFLLFLGRIRVIEAHVAGATKALGQAEVQTDRFGMAKVQVTIRLWRKTRANRGWVERTGFLLCCRARFS